METCLPGAKLLAAPPVALELRSSHVETFFLHTMVAAIAEELWRRDHRLDLCVLKGMTGDSGYDLVLSCDGFKRYIQMKHSLLKRDPASYSLWHDFSKVAGGCAVVLVHAVDPLEIDHCLFFGGGLDGPMPPVLGFPKTLSPGRRAMDAARRVRENLFDVPREKFQGPISFAEMVSRLFPRLKTPKLRSKDSGLPRISGRDSSSQADPHTAAVSPISDPQSCPEASGPNRGCSRRGHPHR
jgi:hypothetical protein